MTQSDVAVKVSAHEQGKELVRQRHGYGHSEGRVEVGGTNSAAAASGLRQARKHLGWYFDRHASHAPAALRASVMTADNPRDVMRLLRIAFLSMSETEPARSAA